MAKKSNKGLQPLAMVQPPPTKTEHPKMISIEHALRLAGNNRPYTVIAQAVDHWIVHLSGDYAPSMLMQVKGKWVIVRD